MPLELIRWPTQINYVFWIDWLAQANSVTRTKQIAQVKRNGMNDQQQDQLACQLHQLEQPNQTIG